MNRLWLLRLVPPGRFGRWFSAAVIFALMVGMLAWAGLVLGEPNDRFDSYIAWFFCVIMAYIVPIFHFITRRTEEAFDDLAGLLPYDAQASSTLRQGISSKSMLWVGVNLMIAVTLWLGQSWLLTGGSTSMMATLLSDFGSSVGAISPLLVWTTMTCAVHALIDNARLFRRLARKIDVELLDTRALAPFGRMAISSTLVVVGSQASFSIMWLGDATSIWTTIPGLIPTTAALGFLFFAPVWPVHTAIRLAKHAELARLQDQINAIRWTTPDNYQQLNPLLIYRREILAVSEWPFDLGMVTRLALYLIIVPLTWIGAALIENVVDFVVG